MALPTASAGAVMMVSLSAPDSITIRYCAGAGVRHHDKRGFLHTCEELFLRFCIFEFFNNFFDDIGSSRVYNLTDLIIVGFWF